MSLEQFGDILRAPDSDEEPPLISSSLSLQGEKSVIEISDISRLNSLKVLTRSLSLMYKQVENIRFGQDKN